MCTAQTIGINLNGVNPVISIRLFPATDQFGWTSKYNCLANVIPGLFAPSQGDLERECILNQNLCFDLEADRITGWSPLTGVSKSSKQVLFIVNTIYCVYSLLQEHGLLWVLYDDNVYVITKVSWTLHYFAKGINTAMTTSTMYTEV